MNAEDFEAVASILVAFFLGAALLVPILAVSARFALKPVMETWMKLRAGQTSDQDKILQDRRIALLEAELQSMQQRLDVQDFDSKLTPRQPDSQLPPAQ